MMLDPADIRFFQALARISADKLGPDAACSKAAAKAAETGHPDDLRAARAALDALAPGSREAVMAQLHQAMRSDLSAIWDMMPGAQPGGRAN